MRVPEKAEGRPLVLKRGGGGEAVEDVSPHVRIVHRGVDNGNPDAIFLEMDVLPHGEISQPFAFFLGKLLACPLDGLGGLWVESPEFIVAADVGIVIAHHNAQKLEVANDFQALVGIGIVSDSVADADVVSDAEAFGFLKDRGQGLQVRMDVTYNSDFHLEADGD